MGSNGTDSLTMDALEEHPAFSNVAPTFPPDPWFWCNSSPVSIFLLVYLLFSLSCSCLCVFSSNHLPFRHLFNICLFISVRSHSPSSSGLPLNVQPPCNSSPTPHRHFNPILPLRLSTQLCLAWVSIRLVRRANTSAEFAAFQGLAHGLCVIELLSSQP